MLSTITTIIWIGLFVSMFVFKKHFTLPDRGLSKKPLTIIIVISVLIFLINGLFLTSAYYKAYHPDYEYEKVSSQVDFHIYQPTYLPSNVEQGSKFYLGDKEFAGNSKSVRFHYDVSFTDLAKGVKPKLIIFQQTKVSENFDVENYIRTTHQGEAPLNLQPITLQNVSVSSAYLETVGYAKIVYVLMSDSVLVYFGSVNASSEELEKIAASLK